MHIYLVPKKTVNDYFSKPIKMELIFSFFPSASYSNCYSVSLCCGFGEIKFYMKIVESKTASRFGFLGSELWDPVHPILTTDNNVRRICGQNLSTSAIICTKAAGVLDFAEEMVVLINYSLRTYRTYRMTHVINTGNYRTPVRIRVDY